MVTLLSSALFYTKADAASNTNWKTVTQSYNMYVKYGKYKIKYNADKLYIKGKNVNKIINNVWYTGGGNVITNGTNIIYQKGKTLYLWKPKSNKKLFSVKKNLDLIGRYGNNYYFAHWDEYENNTVYIYNIKTHKVKKTKHHNGYYINGKYMLIDGNFHEGGPSGLSIYNMQTGKTKGISTSARCGASGIISGNYVYYSAYVNKNVYDERLARFKIIKYNIKTGKKTTLMKGLKTEPFLINKNYYYYYDYNYKTFDSKIKIKHIKQLYMAPFQSIGMVMTLFLLMRETVMIVHFLYQQLM